MYRREVGTCEIPRSGSDEQYGQIRSPKLVTTAVLLSHHAQNIGLQNFSCLSVVLNYYYYYYYHYYHYYKEDSMSLFRVDTDFIIVLPF